MHGTLDTVRSMPRMLAMSLVQRDLGPRSPWGRFRLAVERFDALLLDLVARRRAEPGGRLDARPAARAARRGRQPADATGTCATSSWRCWRPDTTPRRRRSSWAFERLARHPAVHARLRDGDPAYLDAVVKEVLRARPALTIAPRRLLEPVEIAGRTLPAGVHVAACLWLALRREDLWPQAGAFRPERWLEGAPPPNPMSWIPFGGGVRRCAGAPFAEMEMREVLRAAASPHDPPRPTRSPSAPAAARSS